ncbi:hypothetical protein R3P38DRAFT_3253058 [Favolaschia claudopus]|uniref:Uncharacterized protein n=1 Tax=Favolaschia claudopus TaxID=2862362 RepID=A0AAW0E199_9AGAR
MFPLFLLLPLPLFFCVAGALQNVTVDETDSKIFYAGSWFPQQFDLDYGGSHVASGDSTASALFTFTGTAVYYLAPRYSWPASVRLTVDEEPAVTVNLTNPNGSPGSTESLPWSAVWSAKNLPNTRHRVFVRAAPTDETFIVDGFIYTVDNDVSTQPNSPESPAPSASPRTSSNKLAIGIGIALGVVALIAAGVAAYFLFYRRRKQARKNKVLDEWGQDAHHTPTPFVTGMGAASSRRTDSQTTMMAHETPEMANFSELAASYAPATSGKGRKKGEPTKSQTYAPAPPAYTELASGSRPPSPGHG